MEEGHQVPAGSPTRLLVDERKPLCLQSFQLGTDVLHAVGDVVESRTSALKDQLSEML